MGYLLNVSLVYPIYFRETVHGEQCENDLEHSSVNHWQNPINPFVHNFLGKKRPLKILPTKNLFLGIDLDSMMSKIDLDCFGIH